ncbi:hypothetical protein AQUCO_01700642v1 [Aquilegia coerulea]|uniref:Poly A polymerase head domain-containing protein n=1 Tax=Aquilegia coerulea TaxID=218851 RepID=A0A2G5DP76_AQUCA|nr:hypothetical protein AQUCO_01700642v1 [Aquilegia coerulea]
MEIALNPHRLITFQRYINNLTFSSFKLPSRCAIKFPNFHFKSELGFFPRSFCCRSMVSLTEPIKVKEKIDLTEIEKKIFDRLLEVVRYYSRIDSNYKETQLRVAGGWVRDKLLGKECYDIDIALDNMLGREFCEKVNEYLSNIGEEKQGIGVIQCNPDQSKHLETARMRLYDIWIDFVNLRSEDYSDNSRIPTMKFGTAEEDAYRRDLTINSLFYNINTNSVEDFTKRGLAHLRSGKIVTPLPPKETFLDDPLRVLRAIRFGFVLKPPGFCYPVDFFLLKKKWTVSSGCCTAQCTIDLMISGNEPVKAMVYTCDLQLFWVVFSLPNQSETLMSEEYARRCVSYIDAAWRLLQVVGFSTFNDEERRLYLYGALFLPLRKSVYTDGKGKKVMKLHAASESFRSWIPFITSDKSEQFTEDSERKTFQVPDVSGQRIIAGKLLREIKSLWRVSLLISILISPTDFSRAGDFSEACAELDKSQELYKRIEHAIMELGLDNVWEMKPLINGKEIMNILQLKTGGPKVREWQKKSLEWQLAHPSATGEECQDWMRQELEAQTHCKRVKLEEVSSLE